MRVFFSLITPEATDAVVETDETDWDEIESSSKISGINWDATSWLWQIRLFWVRFSCGWFNKLISCSFN